MLSLLPVPARAATLELLGPSSRVPPEGFLIALAVRDGQGTLQREAAPRVTAQGATVLPGPPQPPLNTFLIVPHASAREVTVTAEARGLRAQQRFSIGPPAARVELALEPSAPVKGRDREATLRVKLLTPEGVPDATSPPPILRSNVGELAALEREGPGVYTARYLLPETRYPEVAIVVALAPWPHPSSIHGALGALRVPLATAIELPGRTEANAQMSIEIAGEKYGPVTAGSDGRFRLPVVVPPGYRYAKGTAVDRARNRRVSRVDLQLPPTDQLACVMNPNRLPADGSSQARLLCATSDPYGKPAARARVTVRASQGSLKGPAEVEPGLLEWTYTAPREAKTEAATLTATWKQAGPTSKEERLVELVQGPAEQLELLLEEPVAHLGGTYGFDVEVKDGFGRPRPGASATFQVPVGTVTVSPSDASGRARASWTLPSRGELGLARIEVRAFGPAGKAPARLSAFVRDGVLGVAITDLAGLPIPGERIRVDGRELLTGPEGTVDAGPLTPGKHELVDAVWPGLTQTIHVLDVKGLIFPAGTAPGSKVVSSEVRLAPPLPVNVKVRVEKNLVTYWVERPDGSVVPDREVSVRLAGDARRSETRVEGARRSFRVESSKPTTVTLSDVETGVTAIAEVRP